MYSDGDIHACVMKIVHINLTAIIQSMVLQAEISNYSTTMDDISGLSLIPIDIVISGGRKADKRPGNNGIYFYRFSN